MRDIPIHGPYHAPPSRTGIAGLILSPPIFGARDHWLGYMFSKGLVSSVNFQNSRPPK